MVALLWTTNAAHMARSAEQKSAPADSAVDPRVAQAVRLFTDAVAQYQAGDYERAIPKARKAVQLLDAALDPNDPALAQCLTTLAELYRLTRRNADAEPLYRRALAIREKSLAPDSPDVASSLNNLALLLNTTARSAEAEPLYRRALAIREKVLGPDDPDVAITLNNLARLLEDTGRYGEADPLYRRALAIREKAFGPDDPAVTRSLNNLASLLQTTEQYAEAEPLYRRALAIRERTLGPDDPDVATSLDNLASLLESTGRYEESEPLYRRELAIDEKALGPDHPDVATDLNNLASLLVTTGRYAEAEPLFRRALAIREKSLGLQDSAVATSLNNLAMLLETTGRYVEAEPLFRQALAIDEKALGSDHPSVATDLNDLASLLNIKGRSTEAEPLYRRALAIDEKTLGPDHQLVAIELNDLAVLLDTAGHYAEAESLYRRALTILEKSLGADHPDVARGLNNLASLLKVSNRDAEAEPLLLRAYRIASTAGDPEVLWGVQSELRDFYADTKPSLAIFYGKQAVNTLQSIRAGWSASEKAAQKAFTSNVSAVYRHLADLLIDQGRLAEAEQVLDLLKERELFEYLRRDSDTDAVHSTPVYSRTEDPLAQRYANISARVTALGREHAILARINPSVRNRAQIARLTELDTGLHAAQEEVRQFIVEVNATFGAQGGQRAVEFGEPQLKLLAKVPQSLKELGKQGHPAILVHYLVMPKRVRILVTTADAKVHRDSATGEVQLKQLVAEYRQSLQNANRDPRPQAKALYDALIGPIVNDLAQAGPATLMFSLDGVLRYLPMAALYDGQHWLIENGSIVMYTAAAPGDLNIPPQAQWRVAGLGVSQGGHVGADSFQPLPAVPSELGAIVRDGQAHTAGVLPGVERLDKAFTREALVEAASHYPVLHIASHFNFKPTQDGSYLLLGNNQALTLADFRTDRHYRLTSVDLLTLSACETALDTVDANGHEIEGLGALAQEQGAKSVMATLWSVYDSTTGRLMQRFYEDREKRHLTKADALREAQLAFIRGDAADGGVSLATDRGSQKTVRDPEPGRLAYKPDPKTPYAHPYYWAPFILMGNWL